MKFASVVLGALLAFAQITSFGDEAFARHRHGFGPWNGTPGPIGGSTPPPPSTPCPYSASAASDGCTGAVAQNSGSAQHSDFFTAWAAQTYTDAGRTTLTTYNAGGTAGFTFTGSVAAGTSTLTVSAITGTPLAVGQSLTCTDCGTGLYIAALGSGSGGTGTYTLSNVFAAGIASQSMKPWRRPPWNVAGADYPTGANATTATVDPFTGAGNTTCSTSYFTSNDGWIICKNGSLSSTVNATYIRVKATHAPLTISNLNLSGMGTQSSNTAGNHHCLVVYIDNTSTQPITFSNIYWENDTGCTPFLTPGANGINGTSIFNELGALSIAVTWQFITFIGHGLTTDVTCPLCSIPGNVTSNAVGGAVYGIGNINSSGNLTAQYVYAKDLPGHTFGITGASATAPSNTFTAQYSYFENAGNTRCPQGHGEIASVDKINDTREYNTVVTTSGLTNQCYSYQDSSAQSSCASCTYVIDHNVYVANRLGSSPVQSESITYAISAGVMTVISGGANIAAGAVISTNGYLTDFAVSLGGGTYTVDCGQNANGTNESLNECNVSNAGHGLFVNTSSCTAPGTDGTQNFCSAPWASQANNTAVVAYNVGAHLYTPAHATLASSNIHDNYVDNAGTQLLGPTGNAFNGIWGLPTSCSAGNVHMANNVIMTSSSASNANIWDTNVGSTGCGIT